MNGLLRHSLVIERVAYGAENEHAVPSETWSTLSTVRGLIQPRSAQEMAQVSQGGPVASDHVAYLMPTDLRESDRIRMATDDGRRWQIDGVRDAAGMAHHLEVDCHLVEAT